MAGRGMQRPEKSGQGGLAREYSEWAEQDERSLRRPAPTARTINNYSLAAWKYFTTVRTNGFASGGTGTSPRRTVSNRSGAP